MVEKFWGSSWWGHAWLYILKSPLVHPLIQLHIISCWIQSYPTIIVYLRYSACHLCIQLQLHSWFHLLSIRYKCQSCIFWTSSWRSLSWCITWTSNALPVQNNKYILSVSIYLRTYSITHVLLQFLLLYSCIFLLLVICIKSCFSIYSLRIPLVGQPHK